MSEFYMWHDFVFQVFPTQPWQKYFFNGLKNKILTQRLSDDFAGMSFPDASR